MQPGILLPPPPAALALSFRLRGDPAELKVRLAGLEPGEGLVLGLGLSLVRALGAQVEGLRELAPLAAPGVGVPSTPRALWAWVRAAEPGEALQAGRRLLAALGPGVALEEELACFTYAGGRDLSGYEDGTENPKAEAALEAAFIEDGSSFVAVQRWVHDLRVMERMSAAERDATVGRELESNDELPEAPPTAHVKRAAQESFEPAAFMLRRSMPYGTLAEHGLNFVAFGRDLDRFERIMRRMAGLDDGVVDAIFRFSRPVSGAAFWCPPLRGGRLDLSRLG